MPYSSSNALSLCSYTPSIHRSSSLHKAFWPWLCFYTSFWFHLWWYYSNSTFHSQSKSSSFWWSYILIKSRLKQEFWWSTVDCLVGRHMCRLFVHFCSGWHHCRRSMSRLSMMQKECWKLLPCALLLAYRWCQRHLCRKGLLRGTRRRFLLLGLLGCKRCHCRNMSSILILELILSRSLISDFERTWSLI